MATAARYLCGLELKIEMTRRIVRCSCASGPCGNVPDQDLPGGAWSHCPLYVLRSPWWRTVVALWQEHSLCGKIAADKLAAWAVFGVITLRDRIDNGGNK